jgi:hypothetical protein
MRELESKDFRKVVYRHGVWLWDLLVRIWWGKKRIL